MALKVNGHQKIQKKYKNYINISCDSFSLNPSCPKKHANKRKIFPIKERGIRNESHSKQSSNCGNSCGQYNNNKRKKLSKGKNKKIRRISKKPTPKGAKIACGNFVLKASKIEQQNSRNYFENSWQKQQQRIMSIGR